MSRTARPSAGVTQGADAGSASASPGVAPVSHSGRRPESRSSVERPWVAARRGLAAASRPSSPSPSLLVKPTTCPAVFPRG